MSTFFDGFLRYNVNVDIFPQLSSLLGQISTFLGECRHFLSLTANTECTTNGPTDETHLTISTIQANAKNLQLTTTVLCRIMSKTQRSEMERIFKFTQIFQGKQLSVLQHGSWPEMQSAFLQDPCSTFFNDLSFGHLNQAKGTH